MVKGYLLSAVLALCIAVSPMAIARGQGGGHHSTHSASHPPRANSSHSGRHAAVPATRSGTSHHGKSAAAGVARDSHGKIKRSQQAKNDFKHQQPCPSTGKSSGACPGYIIDHVTPLKRGGADSPGNMQWQTKEAAKQKDKWE